MTVTAGGSAVATGRALADDRRGSISALPLTSAKGLSWSQSRLCLIRLVCKMGTVITPSCPHPPCAPSALGAMALSFSGENILGALPSLGVARGGMSLPFSSQHNYKHIDQQLPAGIQRPGAENALFRFLSLCPSGPPLISSPGPPSFLPPRSGSFHQPMIIRR